MSINFFLMAGSSLLLVMLVMFIEKAMKDSANLICVIRFVSDKIVCVYAKVSVKKIYEISLPYRGMTNEVASCWNRHR